MWRIFVRSGSGGSIKVLRIIQENLTNVAKHLGASKVMIHIREDK